MEPIYLDLVSHFLFTKELTMEDFFSFIEGLYKSDKTVCFYESSFAKTPIVCCTSFKDFQTWWTALEAKKDVLLKKIEASKLKVEVISE